MPIDEKELYIGLSEKIATHDRHIDTLSHAIEDLAATNGVTNTKIDKLIDAIGTQNVLIEKVNNMDRNISDSFKRRDERITALENVQDNTGCRKVLLAAEITKSVARSVDRLREDIQDVKLEMESRIYTVEEKTSTFVSGNVVRWALGIMLTVVLVVSSIDRNTNTQLNEAISLNAENITELSLLATEQKHTQRQININNSERFSDGKDRMDELAEAMEDGFDELEAKGNK